MIRRLLGKVTKGRGNATKNFAAVAEIIAERVGINSLVDGTLNVMLNDHYAITVVDGVIGPEEYKHYKECIKLRRCRIGKAGGTKRGLKAVIVRPSGHEDPKPKNACYWMRLEIMSEYHVMNELGLCFGDQVEVEVEKDFHEDRDWWEAPEPGAR